MKRFARYMLYYAVFFIASAFIQAQAAGISEPLSWTAPTTNTSGTPIVGALTYNLYQGSSTPPAACTLGVTPVQTGITAASITVTGLLDDTTYCWAVTALDASEGGVESAKSNTATKTFPPATPNAPTGLTAP